MAEHLSLHTASAPVLVHLQELTELQDNMYSLSTQLEEEQEAREALYREKEEAEASAGPAPCNLARVLGVAAREARGECARIDCAFAGALPRMRTLAGPVPASSAAHALTPGSLAPPAP